MEIRSHVPGQSLKLWVFWVGTDMRSQRERHSITVGHVKGTGTSPRVEDEGDLWQQNKQGRVKRTQAQDPWFLLPMPTKH